MIRRTMSLMMCLCLLATPVFATVERAVPLSAEELYAWRDSLWETVRTQAAENDPAATYDPETDDVWLFAYPLGMVTATAPTMDGPDNPIAEVELLSAVSACPRGLRVGDPADSVLAAYANDNPELAGSARYATLYTRSDDSTSGWGWLMRRNQSIDAVEYVVATPDAGMEGFVQVLSVFYVISGGVISSIRVGGFGSLIAMEDVTANVAAVREIAADDSYSPVAEYAEASPFSVADLTFSGIAFESATPDDVIAMLGTPDDDITDEASRVRTLSYPYALVESTQSGSGTWRLDALLVTDSDLAGPRDLRVGDTLQSVYDRLGYGDAEDALIFLCTGENGETYALSCSFYDDVLTEYLVYRI